MTDLMQAVSYLSGRAEVDPLRIGAMGYSMGSFVVTLTCAVETRLRACVAVGGGNLDGPMEYWDHGKMMCQGIPYLSLMFLGDRPAALYAMRASIGPMLVFNGTAAKSSSRICSGGLPDCAVARRESSRRIGKRTRVIVLIS
jgi:hypothetical protein